MAEFYRSFGGRSHLGPVAAALVVGVSVWCAAGTVSVLTAEAASPRLLVSAPWWIALVATGMALFVPGWRSRPLTALPALLTTLPWWPLPWPAVVLLWTGPLAWVPIGAALVCSGLFVPGGRTWREVLEPSRGPVVAFVGSLCIAGFAAWSLAARVPGGDEPHYLVITQSLLNDGDLQIENNHDARDYASYFAGTIAPDYLARGQNGAIYSIHAPGVSALVLPGFALAGFRGAQVTLLLVFGLTGALIWIAAFRLTADATAAWFAWAAITGSTTMAVLSVMVFPDAPGACAVAAGVWVLVVARQAPARLLVAVSIALAALPWLHTRFAVLAGVLGVAIVGLLMSDSMRPVSNRWKRVATFLAVPALSALGWLASFYLIYGTFDPRAPYGPNPELRSWIWSAVAGLFVDQQFGLWTYAPVLATAALGVAVAAPRHWRTHAGLCLGMLLVYTMAVASYWMWWAGVPGLPARFLTAALPLLTLPLAVLWAQSRPLGRSWLLALLAVSLATTALILGVDDGAMAWNGRNGQSLWLEWLTPVVNLPRAWPSFFWREEGEFLWHAGVVMITVGGVWGLAHIVNRRLTSMWGDSAPARRLSVTTGVLGGAMALVSVGWVVTDSAPLDAARSQLAVHGLAGRGAVVRLADSGFTRWNPDTLPLVIRPDQAPLSDVPPSSILTLVSVPSGAYRVDVTPNSADIGQASAGPIDVRVRLGRSTEPLAQVSLVPGTSQSFPLDLPAGAAVLTIDTVSGPHAARWTAALVPQSPAGTEVVFARRVQSYGDVEAYFLDDDVFAEVEGFWVRGGRTADLVMSQGASAAGRPRVLHLRNGGADNTVTIAAGQWREVVTLEPWQEHEIALPASNALGAWTLAMTSSSGFQPSAVSGGDDTRYLGVWVY